MRIDQPGERHFVRIGPTLHLRKQYVGFLRIAIFGAQLLQAVAACFAQPAIMIAPIAVQVFQRRQVRRLGDCVELAWKRCAGREPRRQILRGAAHGDIMPWPGSIVAQDRREYRER
ncbi:MAG: hypothetical protein LC098_04360 [Burkholderiales bacterium]|nr:hypothetical protein [Burkholderiales bacterium]